MMAAFNSAGCSMHVPVASHSRYFQVVSGKHPYLSITSLIFGFLYKQAG